MSYFPTPEQIQLQIKNLSIPGKAFIHGQYVSAQSQLTFDCINPATGKILTAVQACDEHDVHRAVKSARQTFESGIWSSQSPQARKKILLKFADLLEKHQLTLAILETLDTGKPIRDSLNGDLPSAIHCVRWYAELIDKTYGDIAPTTAKQLALITREPLGVVGIVTPWNYPLYIACLKLTPAIAAGNSVIVKPAEQAPLTTLYIAQLASEAGLPDGVLNVVPGMGEIAGKALGLHAQVDCISFTGSTEVGKYFLIYSAQSNMKKIYLECGGKSPNIIFSDCNDLEKAAKLSASEIFCNQGQVCCAPTRLLVEDSIKDIFLEKLMSESLSFQANDPLNINTNLGAVIDEIQKNKIMNYIAVAKKEGAQLILGGKQILESTGGFYMEPTIFDGVNSTMRIAQEEIFGPVLSVMTFHSEDEAIRMANDTVYGLSASLFTQNINKAHRVANALRAGVVSINTIYTGEITTPFGGYKQSGMGREGSPYALDCYTELKTTWLDLND